ncbi:MAG: hypothetical protein HKN33_05400 [Pyrinomonadaceae bacterium]|nr:hypothetical protein [Pyrinomonadaceae bacterium]
MIHFLYLIGFAVALAVVFAAFTKGDINAKLKYGVKSFAQFVLISLLLAWIFYFIPW